MTTPAPLIDPPAWSIDAREEEGRVEIGLHDADGECLRLYAMTPEAAEALATRILEAIDETKRVMP